MGARVSAPKCFALATTTALRAWAKRCTIQSLGRPLNVKLDMRDLGARISFMARNVGSTVTERMRTARITCEMLGGLKASFRTKVACVAAK
eukprot:13458685-Alexandrium_andersonii.AAC.1